MNIIVAYTANRAIGLHNDLLFKIPDDLARFKRMTLGGTVVMGRKTYESIGRPLPGRRNIVFSQTMEPMTGIEVVRDLDNVPEDAFVIGGGEFYKLTLPMCDTIYATQIEGFHKGDTFFPEINLNEWLTTHSPRYEHDGLYYSYVTYKRI